MTTAKDFPAEALASLVDASAAINSAQSLDKTLQAIAAAAAAVMRAEASSVIMMDATRNKQVFRAAVGDRSSQLVGMEYDAGVGISGKVMKTRKSEIINDVTREHSHYKGIDNRTAFQTRSVIAAPLINKGEVLGVVEVINPLHSETFGDEDLQLSQVFANLAAISTANAQLYERLHRENIGLKDSRRTDAHFIGQSSAMREVIGLIEKVAPSTATVLLLGETGTGKELAAHMIHQQSGRRDRPFIAVNCAALPETLLESELFGHEAGAFTGATGRTCGRFELAEGGTIFLDEIGEINLGLQVKLLRVLQEKEIVRVGGTQTISCDVRIIAATNRDLAAEIKANRFREDLYYRLSVFPIEMPPLRDRRDDIPLLVSHVISTLAAKHNHPRPKVSESAMAALTGHDYPGNIRELQNIIERACLLCCCSNENPDQAVLGTECLPHELVGRVVQGGAKASALAIAEKAVIVSALRENRWNQSATARALGISRDNIRYRIRKYGIKKPEVSAAKPQ